MQGILPSSLYSSTEALTVKSPEARSIKRTFDMSGRSVRPVAHAGKITRETDCYTKKIDKDTASEIITRFVRRAIGKRAYQHMFDDSIRISWKNNPGVDAVKSMQEISRENLRSRFRLLTPLKDIEKEFLHVFLKTKFFVTHATNAEITSNAGNVFLYSAKKLNDKKIGYESLGLAALTAVDMVQQANDDFVFFSLESGKGLQKKSSRFGETIYRFELNDILKNPAWMSLTDTEGRRTPASVKKHIQFIPEEVEIFLYEMLNPEECSFYQRDILPGLALSIISKSRLFPESEQRRLLSMRKPAEINKILNGLFRPEVKVPVHYFSSSFTQAILVNGKVLDQMKVNDISYMTKMLKKIKNNHRYLVRHSSNEIRSNRQYMMLAVSKDGLALQQASEALKADRELVLVAIQNNGNALQYAGEALKADRDLVLAAVQNNGNALQYASEALKANRDLVLAAIQNNGNALQYASEALKANRDLVLVAVQDPCHSLKVGNPLHYASEALRDDRGIVLAAVKNECTALIHASKTLKADRDFIMAAISGQSKPPFALQYASNELRYDRNFMLPFIKKGGWLLGCTSEALRADRDFVLTAVQQDGTALKYASEALKANRDLVLTAVQSCGRALEYANEALKADRDLVMVAIRKNWDAFEYASEALKADHDFVQAAAEESVKVLMYANNTVKQDLAHELYAEHKGLQRMTSRPGNSRFGCCFFSI